MEQLWRWLADWCCDLWRKQYNIWRHWIVRGSTSTASVRPGTTRFSIDCNCCDYSTCDPSDYFSHHNRNCSSKKVNQSFAKNYTFFFSQLWGSTSSHICYPIRLVFHQHLNLHTAYLGSPAEPSNHTRGQFLLLPSYPLLRLLWSKSDNKVTRKRILDQYHTLALHLAQPHCASVTKHGHHLWHHISNLPQ